jgi:hypothetical protein
MREAIKLSVAEESERMPGHGLRLGAARVWAAADHRVPPGLLYAASRVDYRYWAPGDLQDQGPVPHCVEYATRSMIEGSPIRLQAEGIARGSIYDWCQRNDEWAGTNYDGTSVHAAMKWALAHGYISSYKWAKSVEEAHAWLMTNGIIVAGTTWWEHMSYVDEFGYARIGGANYGGHAYVIRGGNRLARDPRYPEVKGKRKLRNNWGLEYGEGGEAWINDRDFAALIEDYGEIALPVEVKRSVS